jgi:hypothetical protein
VISHLRVDLRFTSDWGWVHCQLMPGRRKVVAARKLEEQKNATRKPLS